MKQPIFISSLVLAKDVSIRLNAESDQPEFYGDEKHEADVVVSGFS